MYVKQACSRTIQTSGADRFVRGAHHRRCAREGLIGGYDALWQRKLQVSRALDHYFRQQIIIVPNYISA